MYEFRDVNEDITLVSIPAEAMQINGSYLETEIEGYRTLYVKGREALSPALETLETGTRDGSVRKSKRYPARIITVGYQLIAADAAAFRAAYNKLGTLLNVNDAELIFRDEDDKFFIGTPTHIGEVPEGRNAITSEIEITCLDPLKYSVIEYEAGTSMDDPRSILVDYNGSYRSYPVLEADFYHESEADGETVNTLTGSGDCGYVAFFNEAEKIIQLGDPDEEDGTIIQGKSVTLANQLFNSTASWGTAAKGLWLQNTGALAPDVIKAGTIGMKVATYAVPSNPPATSGTILSGAKTPQGAPTFYYTVTLRASGRTSNSVNISAAITASLKYSGSYFGRGYGLTGSLYIGGAWRNVTIKKTSEYWRGKSGHTVNMSFTVTGLSEGTASLTGIRFKVTRSDGAGNVTGKLPETACSNLKISPYEASVPATYYLGAASYGTASGKYHGPTISRTVEPSQDFALTWRQKMSIGNGKNDTRQMGAFQATLATSSGIIIAGIRILKNKAGKTASLIFYVNGAKKHTADIDLSYGGSCVGTSSIAKSGAKISFDIGGYKKVFTDDSIKDVSVTQITLGFEQYSTVNPLTHNGLSWVKFVKNNRDTWKDIPNKFSANDVVEADCKNGEIYLNGNRAPQLGALGNDWEEFCLKPGLNQIGIAYSFWVTDDFAPAFKVRYREAFL